MANIYDKVPIKVQKKSGFDKSFQNLFTSKIGTITPILTDELIPNTTVSLRMALTTQMPPLASDTFMRVKQKYAAFFVPTRILMASYEDWLVGKTNNTDASLKIRVPVYTIQKKNCAPGTLADYLGVKLTKSSTTGTGSLNVCALPFLAYHKIYNDWFRNSLIQKPIFTDSPLISNSTYSAARSNVVVPYSNASTADNYTIIDADSQTQDEAHSQSFYDGVKLFQLRQANFGADVYTSCTTSPQNGTAQSVSFQVINDGGKFTISALRAANSMQQFLERNNLAGNRLVDYVKAQYGANLGDSVAQRPVLLGSGSFDVYSKGIYQTADVVGADTENNPMKSVATKYGNAFVEGNDLVIKGFTAMEPGYLMVVTWLSPKVTYSTGLDPMLSRYTRVNSQSDMANPILQNVGNEPIYTKQLNSNAAVSNSTSVFGYNDRYAN